MTLDELEKLVGAATPGNMLKSFRQKRGLSLQQLAEACNLSKAYIWDLERGAAPLDHVSYLNLCNIAAALGVSLTRLMHPNGHHELTQFTVLREKHDALIASHRVLVAALKAARSELILSHKLTSRLSDGDLAELLATIDTALSRLEVPEVG